MFGAVRPAYFGPILAALSAAMICALVYFGRSGKWVWVDRKLSVSIGALAAWTVLSFVLSKIPSVSLVDLARGGACLLAFIGALQFFRGRSETRFFFQLLTFFGGILSAFGLAQVAGGFSKEWWHRADLLSGTYVNHNHFAGFLEMTLPAGLALSVYEKEIPKKAMYLFATALMIVAFIFTLSRGGFVAILAALGVWFLAVQGKKIQGAVLPFVLFGVLATTGIAAFGTRPIEHRLAETRMLDDGGDLSLTYRMWSWRGAMELVRQSPVWGNGPGTFGSLYLSVRPQPSHFRPVHAHNDYLEAAAETGLVGLVLVLVPVVLLMAAAWRAVQLEESRFVTLALAAAMSSTAAFLVHALVDFNHEVPANAILSCTMIGFLAADGATHRMRIARGVRTAAVILTAGLLAGGILLGISDAWLSASEGAFSRHRFPEAANAAERAATWNAWSAEAAYRRGLADVETSADPRQKDQKEALLNAAAVHFQRAIVLNPYEPYYDYHLGRALLLQSLSPTAVRQAVAVLENGVAKDPKNGRLRHMCGMLLVPAAAADWRWRPAMEKFFGDAMRLDSPDQVDSIYETLARQARYSTAELLRFHQSYPQDAGGWLHYLEAHHLWSYHRKFLLESLGRSERTSDGGTEGWIELPDTRKGFWDYFSTVREVDVKIQPTYEISSALTGPIPHGRLRIEARGTPARHAYPYLYVKLDGMILDSIYVDSSEFKTYRVPLTVPPGNHTLTIRYVNDYTDPVGRSYRNLWLKDAVLEARGSAEGGEAR